MKEALKAALEETMKILIVSDTHRRDGNLQTVIEKTAHF